jgi:hypothetical protein
MNTFSIKYKRTFSVLFLGFYLIFMGISMFHSHDLDLLKPVIATLSDESKSHSSFDPYLNDDGKCLVHQFHSSISLRYTEPNEIKAYTEKSNLSLSKEEDFSLQDYQTGFYLRGPPKV